MREKKKELTWNSRRRICLEFLVYFVRNVGLMQLVGDLVVCWNELDAGGQGEAWRNETRRCGDELQLQINMIM